MALIGREREQHEVVDRLSTRRLVTVIGPAGIGKTAVARAVADVVGPRFEHGAHPVDLTRVDTSESVAGAIAAQLGFGSFESLLHAPSDQPTLVVVDNCEHVTEAAADAVTSLLDACGAVSVLATSRSPLDVPGESLVVLGPLAVPAIGQTGEGSDAVRLFLERARDAGVELGPEHADAVAELCRRLDGLPLALELAAARTRGLAPAEILDRLADGVDVLARPRFRGDHRHRSLTATIDWSYRLLPAEAGQLLQRLALFAGPFPPDLANAVAGDVGLDATAAADTVQLLVDSSLVVADPDRGATRFRLLETVRAFAVQRLRDEGTEDDARRRLADHVVGAAAEILAIGGQRWDQTVFFRLLSLYDTIASTLRWCVEHDDDPTRSVLLTSVLWGVVHQGHTDEIAALGEATLARWPDPTVPFAADAAATVATARCLLGDPAGALDLATRTLPSAQPSRAAPVTLRRAMGYAARALDDRPRAGALFAEVAELARANGLLAMALEADVTRAPLLADDGDLDGALALAAAARAEAAAAGSTVNEVWAETVHAHLVLRRDPAGGIDAVREALATARRVFYPSAIAVNLRSLAWAQIRTGEHRAAAEALTILFDELIARGGVADVRGALYTTAELLYACGDPAWAEVVASAEALPFVALLGGAIDAMVELPDHHDVVPLPRREAIAVARRSLRTLLSSDVGLTPPPVPAPTPPPAPTEGPASSREVARFVDRGSFVEIDFAGRSIHAKAGKGLTDIGRLLAAPGRELHCVDLVGSAVDQSSTGEAIDAEARRQYEDRIRELQADVDEAEANNDHGRAERAQVELDALVEQLASALGLGGRSRRSAGSSAERARSAVTQRIRSTIKRLAADHPELARHLEASIVTGTFCCYRPERPVAWDLTM